MGIMSNLVSAFLGTSKEPKYRNHGKILSREEFVVQVKSKKNLNSVLDAHVVRAPSCGSCDEGSADKSRACEVFNHRSKQVFEHHASQKGNASRAANIYEMIEAFEKSEKSNKKKKKKSSSGRKRSKSSSWYDDDRNEKSSKKKSKADDFASNVMRQVQKGVDGGDMFAVSDIKFK